jgi:hypothetical protein
VRGKSPRSVGNRRRIAPSHRRRLSSGPAILGAAAATITTLWLNHAIGRAHAPLPQLANTDGDPLELVTLHYRLAAAATADGVAAALVRVPDLRDDGDGAHWTWFAPENPSPKRRRRNGTDAPDTGRTIHGTLILKDDTLQVRVNSEARAAGIRGLLKPALAGLVRDPLIERMTAQQAMAEAGPATSALPQAIPEVMDPKDLRRITHEILDRQYRKTLDFEQSSARRPPGDPMRDYDFGWMWDELGISDLRR